MQSFHVSAGGIASEHNRYMKVHLITKISLGLALACVPMIRAADFHPLDVKPGEWESTMTMATTGLPSIPPEALARLPPEQRAKFEDRIKGRPVTSVSCVKKEKLEKPFLWGHENKSCAHTIVTSTGSMQEIHVECSREKSKSSGTVRIEAMNPENIKGSIQMTTTSGEKTMNLNSSFTAKWVGTTCTKE
jgi:hypothetical protein